MFQVGERIGDYEVLRVLGAGGMGQVYKVRNTLSDRVEAMKVLLPSLAGDAQLADRFLREIKVQATLIHKNIAQLYTAQRYGEQILMLLEYVDGVTLDTLMQRGPLTTEVTIHLFTQVLDALSFAHSRGVVHRDIKPQNIMVTADGTAKLMDFGIARMAQDRRLTQTGRTLGSLYYMSPEQIRGADNIDGRSDLYSLGITLYEAATGTRPFEGDSDYTIMAAHLQQPPMPPVERDPRLPKMLSDVILAALEKDCNQRFQSAEAFKSALSQIKGGVAEPAAFSSRAASVVSPPLPPPLNEGASNIRSATEPMAQTPQRPMIAPLPPPPMQAPLPPPSSYPAQPPQQRKSSAGLYMAIGAITFAALAGVGVWQYPRIVGQKPAIENGKTDNAGGAQPQTPATTTTPDPQPPAPTSGQKGPDPIQPANGGGKIPSTPESKPNQQPQQQQQTPPQQTPQSTPQSQPQTGSTTPSSQPPAGSQQLHEPAIDPAVVKELEELRQHYNQLSIRLAGCKEAMAGLEAQQRAQGYGLRGDVKDAARNAEYKMKEAMAAIRNKDVETARQNVEAAERSIDFVSKAMGR